MIPYGRQVIDEDDVQAVARVLRSDWLTTGPMVEEFEHNVAAYVGASHAVAVSNGTAALHCAMFAMGVGPGDAVLTPAITFAATSNSVLYQGATPIFVDVLPDTLLMDPEDAARKMTPKVKVLTTVDFAGQLCDYEALRAVAESGKAFLAADACHSIGAAQNGAQAGALADISVFSFHPVKPMTTGEGGMLTTDDDALAARARRFRNHGIDADFRQREEKGSWFYDMTDLGYNYRLTDIQCALGNSQLKKLPAFLARRRQIARGYDAAFADIPFARPLGVADPLAHAYHLYVVRLDFEALGVTRQEAFALLRGKGVGVNVHYRPPYLHSYYQQTLKTGPGLCPVAEKAYEQILTLPIHPAMSDEDVDTVVNAVKELGER